MMKGKHTKKETRVWDGEEPSELSLPILTTVDKTRRLHCYSAVLSRRDEGVRMEELDRLQAELEAMLSAAAVRLRTLHEELAAFNSSEENKKGSLTLSNNKKRKLNEVRVSKSMKDLSKVRDSAKMEGTSSGNESDNSNDTLFESNNIAEHTSKVVLPKNDTPNKFWASVEPYCGPITLDNIKDLEEMISNCETDINGTKIPPLGKHYTARWADEDMMDEKEAGSGGRRKPVDPASPDARTLLKRASSIWQTRERSAGPLVQRLVSALMEENLTSPLHESFLNNKLEDGDGMIGKLPVYHTTACFERRIRRELEAAGMMDDNKDDVDEILSEIRICDDELKIVAKENKEHLKRLLTLAKQEMTRQEVRNKIKVIDTEILEIYRKTTAAKIKKKQLQKKEREQAWKALKDREALLKTLDSM